MTKLYLSLLLLIPITVQSIPHWIKIAAGSLLTTGAVCDYRHLKPLREELDENSWRWLFHPKEIQELTADIVDASFMLKFLGLRGLTHKYLGTHQETCSIQEKYEDFVS